MTTNDPFAGPFMPAVRITDSSGDPGYAITADPEGTPYRARQLREEAIGR